jgi:hypothetical protein
VTVRFGPEKQLRGNPGWFSVVLGW